MHLNMKEKRFKNFNWRYYFSGGYLQLGVAEMTVKLAQVLQMLLRVVDVVVCFFVTEMVDLVLVILNGHVHIVRLVNFRRQMIQRRP